MGCTEVVKWADAIHFRFSLLCLAKGGELALEHPQASLNLSNELSYL